MAPKPNPNSLVNPYTVRLSKAESRTIRDLMRVLGVNRHQVLRNAITQYLSNPPHLLSGKERLHFPDVKKSS
jgi:hypothetical protein